MLYLFAKFKLAFKFNVSLQFAMLTRSIKISNENYQLCSFLIPLN